MPRAAVSPLLGPRAEICPQGVSFYIADHRKEVTILLNRKRFEPPLIKMPGSHGLVTRVPTHGVRVGQPPKKARYLIIVNGPHHKVPVVRHHAVGENRKRFAQQGFSQHFRERFVVARALEQWESGNRAVEHVVAGSRRTETWSARHLRMRRFRCDRRRSMQSIRRVYASTLNESSLKKGTQLFSTPLTKKSCVPFSVRGSGRCSSGPRPSRRPTFAAM
jgi:hypothetical protein